jgi:hypothetical protein
MSRRIVELKGNGSRRKAKGKRFGIVLEKKGKEM